MEKKDMSSVLNCQAEDCLYNSDSTCTTFAITIGGDEPCCDTYMNKSSSKGGVEGIIAGVGACHVSNCSYNNEFECKAEGIKVSTEAGHPDCSTFKSK